MNVIDQAGLDAISLFGGIELVEIIEGLDGRYWVEVSGSTIDGQRIRYRLRSQRDPVRIFTRLETAIKYMRRWHQDAVVRGYNEWREDVPY